MIRCLCEAPCAQRQSEIFSVQLCVHFVKLCVELFFFFAARTRRTLDAAQRHRILTTHTGSLPRPAALTALYVAARGEPVDARTRPRRPRRDARVVRKQIDAGIDVGNNGEQQREAFFLYVRHRMSGFGGGWTRSSPTRTHYPAFKAWRRRMTRRPVDQQPGRRSEAIGDVRYLDRAPVEAECADFRAALEQRAAVSPNRS